MKCCGKKKASSSDSSESIFKPEKDAQNVNPECQMHQPNCSGTTIDVPYLWFPATDKESNEYVQRLECEYACMQKSVLTMSTHFARMQFRLRQIVHACPCERTGLLQDLERIAFEGLDTTFARGFDDEIPNIRNDFIAIGTVESKQAVLISEVRSHLGDLLEDSKYLSEVGPDDEEVTETSELDQDDPDDDEKKTTKCCGSGPSVKGYRDSRDENEKNKKKK